MRRNDDSGRDATCMPGLFGWPRPDVVGADASPAFEVIGVPSDIGNSHASGARHAPDAIRRASGALRMAGVRGVDRGDVADIGRIDWQDAIHAIRAEVEAIRARGSVPVVLGGDHSVSFPTVAALAAEEPISVVWFDAHTDLCEWREASWHNHKQVLRRIAGLPHVAGILQIGHRGLTYSDESRRSDKMTLFTAGRAATIDDEAVLACLPADRPVYVSVDIDAVDPRWAPGTGHPVPGGLDPALLARLASLIASRRRIVGMDLMEVCPPLDRADATSGVAARILAAMVSAAARTDAMMPDVAIAAAAPLSKEDSCIP